MILLYEFSERWFFVGSAHSLIEKSLLSKHVFLYLFKNQNIVSLRKIYRQLWIGIKLTKKGEERKFSAKE
jgi:hypothetical protein